VRTCAARRYYLNGDDAYRLKLLLPLPPEREAALLLEQQAATSAVL
jgi:hypothetical protein